MWLRHPKFLEYYKIFKRMIIEYLPNKINFISKLDIRNTMWFILLNHRMKIFKISKFYSRSQNIITKNKTNRTKF